MSRAGVLAQCDVADLEVSDLVHAATPSATILSIRALACGNGSRGAGAELQLTLELRRLDALTLQLPHDPFDDDDGRLVENRIGSGEVAAVTPDQAREHAVVEYGNPIAGRLRLGGLVEERVIGVDRTQRVVLRLAQFEGTLAEPVGHLREVPDVAAEHDLRFHLGRGRRPAGGGLHQPYADMAKRGDIRATFADSGYFSHANTSSRYLAVASGSPGLKLIDLGGR